MIRSASLFIFCEVWLLFAPTHASNGGRCEFTGLEVTAEGQDAGTAGGAQFRRLRDAAELGELAHVRGTDVPRQQQDARPDQV